MSKYIVFLRGINVSGKNKILMKDLKLLLSSNGFDNVLTYIQSGNLIVTTSLNKNEVSSKISKLIEEKYSYKVPCITVSPIEIAEIIDNNIFLKDVLLEDKFKYFTICNREINTSDISLVCENKHANANYIKHFKNTIYLYHPDGAGNAKITNNFLEKKLHLIATSRNLNTMKKMLSLCELG